ncbi:DUF4112 domain-containing protein [Aquisediminimonas profunda]|uniref:DUF4112 domain-containing protein n=1 Tax=Aquisediminimonas profunda TaxID=1550733 RepID=UPI001C62B4AA|nr:DUF4112 domain-containing protein [Aquisediminimonas profunda]
MPIGPETIDRINARAGEFAGRHPVAVRRRIEAMEKLLEGMIVIPGTRQRVGLDVLLDLIPVGGSVIAAAMGSYLAWEARNLGMPKSTILRMAGNIGFDALLGAIPLVGAVPDFFFRSNTRNLRIIKKHLDRHHPGTVTIER